MEAVEQVSRSMESRVFGYKMFQKAPNFMGVEYSAFVYDPSTILAFISNSIFCLIQCSALCGVP